jgi:hypothetical protein
MTMLMLLRRMKRDDLTRTASARPFQTGPPSAPPTRVKLSRWPSHTRLATRPKLRTVAVTYSGSGAN